MPTEEPNSEHEPTSNREPRSDLEPSSYLEGAVVEGRPVETIGEDGTISLQFESSEKAAKRFRQEDRRRRVLQITRTS